MSRSIAYEQIFVCMKLTQNRSDVLEHNAVFEDFEVKLLHLC